VGDDLYSTKKTREQNTRLHRQEKINIGRIFLVADKLSFIDLKENQQTYTIKLPDKLNIFLKNLK
jgi:hypothetical protein